MQGDNEKEGKKKHVVLYLELQSFSFPLILHHVTVLHHTESKAVMV